MKFLLSLILLATLLSAKPYTISQVKKEYYKIQRMVDNGELYLRKNHSEDDAIEETAKMYIDRNGVVRFLVLQGASEDSGHKGEYSYDENGELFFSYLEDANVAGCATEIRSYYSGKRLLKRKKRVDKCEAQRGYPFRVDNPRRVFRRVGDN